MEHMLTATSNNPAAAGAGLVAMVCFVACPLCCTRATMLMAYIGNNLGFVAHYALLGQWTAVAMNAFMAVQSVVAMYLVRRPWLRWLHYALMPILVFGSYMTWQASPSLPAMAATTLSTIRRMQGNETVLRAWLLVSTPFWMVHDSIVGSSLGLIADILSMATGATMLLIPSIRAAMTSAYRLIRWAG
jgi:Bacterial inner membrane protein